MDGPAVEHLEWNSTWSASMTEGELRLIAGLDRQFAVDGLTLESSSRVLAAQKNPALIPLIEPELVDHLVLLGVLQHDRLSGSQGSDRPTNRSNEQSTGKPSSGTRRVAVVGKPEATVKELRQRLGANGFYLCPSEQLDDPDPDITVWLRRRLTDEAPPEQVHLVVDTGNHHTFVFGPLVIPGRTACSNCLDVRIGHRWPVLPLPEQTNLVHAIDLLTALLTLHLNLAFEGRSPLINGTNVFNAETGSGINEPLLKTALCDGCRRPTNGKVALPWQSQ